MTRTRTVSATREEQKETAIPGDPKLRSVTRAILMASATAGRPALGGPGPPLRLTGSQRQNYS
eukprot:239683-Hanusia_phi.AAC.1